MIPEDRAKISEWLMHMLVHYASEPSYTVAMIAERMNGHMFLDSNLQPFDTHDPKVVQEIMRWLRNYKSSGRCYYHGYMRLKLALEIFLGTSFPPDGANDVRHAEENGGSVAEDLGVIMKSLSSRLSALEARLT